MAPIYERLAARARYTEVTFVKVDVDKVKSNVRAIPTFVLYKQGKEVSKLEGAGITKRLF